MAFEIGKTTTSVHDEATALSQKRRAEAISEGTQGGLSMYVQMLLIMCYGLFASVGTSSWQSVLLALPPGLLLMLLARIAYPKKAPAWTLLPLIPALLTDMLIALIALLDLSVTFVIPGTGRLLISLLTCLMIFFSLIRSGTSAYARLGRLALPFLFFSLLWGVLTSVDNMKFANLTPFLGLGIGRTALLALLPLGCVWQGPMCLLMDEKRGKKAPRAYRYMLFAVILAACTAALTALIWPIEGLLSPLSPPKRMMILNQSSSSTVTWSLLVFSWLFALLLVIGACTRSAQRIMTPFIKNKRLLWLFALLPLLLIIWPASVGVDELTEAVVRFSPLRFALALLTVLLTLIFGRREQQCADSNG